MRHIGSCPRVLRRQFRRRRDRQECCSSGVLQSVGTRFPYRQRSNAKLQIAVSGYGGTTIRGRPAREDFPDQLLGDLVRTDRGCGGRPPTCARPATPGDGDGRNTPPRKARSGVPARPAHGVAPRLRRSARYAPQPGRIARPANRGHVQWRKRRTDQRAMSSGKTYPLQKIANVAEPGIWRWRVTNSSRDCFRLHCGAGTVDPISHSVRSGMSGASWAASTDWHVNGKLSADVGRRRVLVAAAVALRVAERGTVNRIRER